MASKHFENKARRAYWSVHLEAWRKSGLPRTVYCRQHKLWKCTFDRWLAVLGEPKVLQGRDKPRRKNSRQPVSRDIRSFAVQAFWAMHVEALSWSNVNAADYAKAHRIDATCLRLWRRRFDADPLQVDWRARVHPSARPKLSSGSSSAARAAVVEPVLTAAPIVVPPPDRRSNRRQFTDAEKLAIVLEAAEPGATAAGVCRRHDIVTSMLFRWRVDLGYGRKEKVGLASVKLTEAGPRGAAAIMVLHDLLAPPDGMSPVDLPDGRRVFAPAGADPTAVQRHVAQRERAS